MSAEIVTQFLNYMGLLAGIMIGMTTFKVVGCKPFCKDGPDWSWKKFLLGLASQLIVLAGTFVVFFVGCQCGPDLMVVEIASVKLTVQGAINTIMFAIIAVYAAKFIINLAEWAGIKDKYNEKNIKPVNSGSAEDFDNPCNHGKLLGYVCVFDRDDKPKCHKQERKDFNKDNTISHCK